MSPGQAIGIALILAAFGIPVIIVGLVYYLKKRLEHKQIMAAIEKGIPLSELRPPKEKQNGASWIRSLTIGITLITIGLSFWFWGPGPSRGGVFPFVAFILFGIGVAFVVHALLNRKYQPKSQLSVQSNVAEDRNMPSVSASETVQQTNE